MVYMCISQTSFEVKTVEIPTYETTINYDAINMYFFLIVWYITIKATYL